MCGIVGYIGKKNATEVVLNGLQRVEYRGYDSTGIAFIKDNNIKIFKKSGRLSQLLSLVSVEETLKQVEKNNSSNIAIGHTRWATHGIPNDTNAHPHTDNSQNIAIVQNGNIL